MTDANFAGKRRLSAWLLLAALQAIVPAWSLAQGNPPITPPAEVGPGAQASPGSVIALGTTRDSVEKILGYPRTGWEINCLGRGLFTYNDGTKIAFVNGRAISVNPSDLTVGTPEQGYRLNYQGKQIVIDPAVLCGIQMPGPMGEVKREVEECYFMAPKFHMYTARPPGPITFEESGVRPLKRVRLY